jgi:hypothetical protein
MAFPVSPTEGQTFTENNTVWIYSAVTGQWNRSVINPLNETLYEFGGSATATGNAGEIQYTDGTNLAASPNLVWDDVNDELEVGGDVVLDDGGTYTTTLQTITPTANRTVSLPDATGTVALVAGSSGQLVYNNAGAQAGALGSVVGATGDVTLGLNGAASTPPLDITGTWFTGGTATTTKPQVLIEPTGATSTAWSTSGTGLGVNAASGFAGNLLDLQVNGTSQAKVTSAGGLTLVGGLNIGPSSVFQFGTSRCLIKSSGANGVIFANLGETQSIAFDFLTSNEPGVVATANTLAQRNGTNAQTFRVYNTFTDASNYERGFLRWSSNVFEVGPEAAGTGTARPMSITAATLKLPNLPTYADNAAALAGSLVAGDVYKTATGELRITV